MRNVVLLLLAALVMAAYPSKNGVSELHGTKHGRKIAVMLAKTGPADFIGRPENDVASALVEQM